MSEHEFACPYCGEGEIMVEIPKYRLGSPGNFYEPPEGPEVETDWPKTGKKVQRGHRMDPENSKGTMIPAMVDEKVPVCSNDSCVVNKHPNLINSDALLEYYEDKILANPQDYFNFGDSYDEG